MVIFIAVIGGGIATLGIWGVVCPASLTRFAQKAWGKPAGMWLISALRVLIGAFFLFAAEQCRIPALIYAIGALSLLAGIAIPLMGFAKVSQMVNWWVSRPRAVLRTWLLLAVAMGVLLVWASVGWPL